MVITTVKDKGRYKDERKRKEERNKESKGKGLNEDKSRKASNRPFFVAGPVRPSLLSKETVALFFNVFQIFFRIISDFVFPTSFFIIFIESFAYHVNIPMFKNFVQIKVSLKNRKTL